MLLWITDASIVTILRMKDNYDQSQKVNHYNYYNSVISSQGTDNKISISNESKVMIKY